ncbi:hypothetical protein GCM10010269_72380 [Streptomyces humidus]|uniref:Uncharacterized protein n=1 Tax=Streptomyces humidus TaxID=52259 RepID=A0A918G8Z4_9ACTN|nr:hypothetical protein GCM10010269_72380 [Streptomyces humidus]
MCDRVDLDLKYARPPAQRSGDGALLGRPGQTAHIQNRRGPLLTGILASGRFVIVTIRVVLHGHSSFSE